MKGQNELVAARWARETPTQDSARQRDKRAHGDLVD